MSDDAASEMNQFLEKTRDSGNSEAKPIADSIASSIGFPKDSFSGREKDALPALIGLAVYSKLPQREREAVLRYAHETFGAESWFFARAQNHAIHQVVQPKWYKTNLSNAELKENAILWGQIRIVVNVIAGTTGAGTYVHGKVVGGENVMKRDWRAITEKLKSSGQFTQRQLRIVGMSYVGAFLAIAAAIANGEASAMMSEVELRIDRGQMEWKDYREVQEQIKNVMWVFQ